MRRPIQQPISDPLGELMVAVYYWLGRHQPRDELLPRMIAAGKAALAAPVGEPYRELARVAAEAEGRDERMLEINLHAVWPDVARCRRLEVANQNDPPGAKTSHAPKPALSPDDPRVTSWSERADLK